MPKKALNLLETDQVIKSYRNGFSQVKLAKQFNVSRRTIQRILTEFDVINPTVTISQGERDMITLARKYKVTVAKFKAAFAKQRAMPI